MKKAFTFIEFLVCVAIVCILGALLVPAFYSAKERAAVIEKQRANPETVIRVGDTVTIDSLNVTGVLNSLPTRDNPMVSILIKGTNSITVLDNINFNLLKKVRQAETW